MPVKKDFIAFSIALSILNIVSSQEKIEVGDAVQIINAEIITFNSREELERYKGSVVIDSGKIVFAGSDTPSLSGNYETINASEKYVIPGLIDSHVHLANVAGMNFYQSKSNVEMVREYFEQLPRSFLYFGYTTLIDMNNYAPDIVNRIKSSQTKPDIYTCGEQVMVMHDFMMEMEQIPIEKRYKLPFVHDHYNHSVFFPDSVDLDLHSVEVLIGHIIEEQNGICVKTLYEDASSGMNVSWEIPSKEILKEIVYESNLAGIPTIIHAPSFKGQMAGIEAGVDIIAHAMWNWSDNPDNILDTLLSEAQIQLLTNICLLQTGYQPTIRAITGEIDILNETLRDDTLMKRVYPDNFVKWLLSEEGDWMKEKILKRPEYVKKTNPEFYQTVRSKFTTDSLMIYSIYDVLKKRVRKVSSFLAKNEANLLFGTDFGVMNMYSLPPGYCGFREMLEWYECDIDLRLIFKSATISNAVAFNLNDRIGSIEKGKDANILILSSDPLEDINAYNEIETVILHGRLIPRFRLAADYD